MNAYLMSREYDQHLVDAIARMKQHKAEIERQGTRKRKADSSMKYESHEPFGEN